MKYTIVFQTAEAIAIETEEGMKIRLLFCKQENKETEHIILENLVNSYEERMMILT